MRVNPPYTALPRRRPNGALLCLLTLLWFGVSRDVASRAATGLLGRVDGGAFVQLLASVFLLFLLVLGFAVLDPARQRTASWREHLGLPARATAGREWGIGAAIGWGAAVLSVLPLFVTGSMNPQLWYSSRAVLAATLSLATAALLTLAFELVFRGVAFRQLAEATGTAWALLLLAVAYAFFTRFDSGGGVAMLVAFLLSILLSNAWLRTHALWLPWGLHFAWTIALGGLFGLPVDGTTEFSTMVQTQLRGSESLTGSGLGPASAVWTIVVLASCFVVLSRVTRDFAWRYTHPPIVAAGYPMDVPPPAAHTAPAAPAPPPPLVQILPVSPNPPPQSGR